ncbi:MAG: hypothetical protein GXY08_14620 [Ruminococcus sp.]|nr:hypothetical protein [Ruminococcus sp.]
MSKLREACLSKKVGIAEYIALLLYIAGLIVIGYFHEFCFDEAQAWQIARSASIKEILTVIPHYEGHPPLWHLILAPFAKLGAPCILSLRLVNTVFSGAAVSLLLFRSPFPKVIKCTLPFTYFFFYQYGVICRPYSMMMLAFMLMAATYSERSSKPWKYILSLSFLCLSTSIGIIIAGGLCLVWTGEIIAELKKNDKLKVFWLDKRFIPLVFILLLAILLFLVTQTADDCYYEGVDTDNYLIKSLNNWKNYALALYLPYESWIGTLMDNDYVATTSPAPIILDSLFGIVTWALIITITKKNKKFLTFFIPYMILTLFMAFFYMSVHHLGIGTLFHIFIFWIMAEENEGIQIPEFMKKLAGGIKNPLIRKFGAAGAIGIYMMNVLFSAVSSFNDIRYAYYPTGAADYIKKHHLEDRKIMIGWIYKFGNSNSNKENENESWFMRMAIPSDHPPVTDNKTLLCGLGSVYLPYFDSNIFMNFNVRFPDDLYMHYAYKEDVQEEFSLWREQGLPDIIIDYCPIDEVYGKDAIKDVRYCIIAEFPYHMNFKLHTTDEKVYMYMREDLIEEYPDIDILYDPRVAGKYIPD